MPQRCGHCRVVKQNSAFNKNKTTKTGLSCWCRECLSVGQRNYYQRNKSKMAERSAAYRKKNGARVAAYMRVYGPAYYRKNKDKVRKAHAAYYRRTRSATIARHVQYQRSKRKMDPNFALAVRCRNRVREKLRAAGVHKKEHIFDLIGCSPSFLRQYLESLWEPGMSWENHGVHGWHIDHKKPCAAFDLTKRAERLACFNWQNLQPLWADANRRKGTKT